MEFSKNTVKHLENYVYALIDPRNEQIFYVGKASSNNRAFDHLKFSKSETEKGRRISEIRSSNSEPKVEVLRYGLKSEEIALEVEAAIIDAIGLENLTNEIRGHGTKRGRLGVEAIERLYGSDPIEVKDISEPCMLFFIQNSYSPTLSELEIYDCTRQFWHQVSKEKRETHEFKIALAIVDSVVVRVYSIVDWFPAGSTFSTRKFDIKPDKWEFVGQLLESHELRDKMLVSESKPIPANQKGYGYVKPKTEPEF
jgi:hypothetical protein